jgi:hypothetical protein
MGGKMGGNVSKKKVTKKNKLKWVNVPSRPEWDWFSEFLVSSMVVNAFTKSKKLPKRIGVAEDCLEPQKDGSAILHYEVTF